MDDEQFVEAQYTKEQDQQYPTNQQIVEQKQAKQKQLIDQALQKDQQIQIITKQQQENDHQQQIIEQTKMLKVQQPQISEPDKNNELPISETMPQPIYQQQIKVKQQFLEIDGQLVQKLQSSQGSDGFRNSSKENQDNNIQNDVQFHQTDQVKQQQMKIDVVEKQVYINMNQAEQDNQFDDFQQAKEVLQVTQQNRKQQGNEILQQKEQISKEPQNETIQQNSNNQQQQIKQYHSKNQQICNQNQDTNNQQHQNNQQDLNNQQHQTSQQHSSTSNNQQKKSINQVQTNQANEAKAVKEQQEDEFGQFEEQSGNTEVIIQKVEEPTHQLKEKVCYDYSGLSKQGQQFLKNLPDYSFLSIDTFL